MEQRKIAVILDNFLLIVGVWLLSYLWTRYYVMNLLVALITATGISLCIIMLINLKRHKNKQKRKKQSHIDSIMNQFLYGGKDFTLDFFYSLFEKKYKAQKYSGFIMVNSTAVFPKFTLGQVSLQVIVDCFAESKRVNAKRMLILSLAGCDKVAKQNIQYLPDIQIDVFDKNKCYDLLGFLGGFPEKRITLAKSKPSIRKLLASALAREKCRHYLFVSIVLLISSYFVKYSIYYIVAASLTLTLSLLSRFDITKNFNKSKLPK